LSFLYDALILVDITNAVKEVETMNAERKTQDSAHSIVANNEYLTLNAGLTVAPNMTEALLPLNSVERVSQDNEIGLTLDRINELDFFLTDEELEDAIQVMRDVRDYKDQIFDIDYVIAEMVDNRLRFTDLRDDMTDFRDEYLLNRDELKETFSSYDGYRLLLFQLIMVLPLCLSMCGVCAMVFEMPCPSMLMSLLMFPLMSLVFFSAGVAMPAAAFLTDHCVDLEGAVSNQLSGRTYPAPEFFNLSTDLQMEEFFNYFSDCSGVRPEMLLKLDQPEELMADNDLNVTMMLQNLTSPPGNWNLTLTPKMTEYVIDMELMWDESMSLMAQTAEKFTCERTSNIYDTLFENVCMDFAPQFALSVSMYLICSLCMCPAVVIGAKGYKRFNPDNVYEGSTTVNVMDVDRHSDSDGEGGGVVSLHTFSNAGVPTGNDSAWGEDDRSY
jgi:hypothetical protein